MENPTAGLHVVFSVTSAYTKGARLCHKDAIRSSLPTYEAPPACNSQQQKEPRPSSAATTLICAGAAESTSLTQRAPEQKPTSANVRRSPSPSIAAALLASCVPPLAGADNLAALTAGTEISAPTPRAPAPAAAAKVLAGKSSNRMVARVGGGAAEGSAQGEPPQNTSSGDQAHVVERKDQLWPGAGVEIERRDDRERNTSRSQQDLRERSSPAHARPGGRSHQSFTTASPATHPYNAQQYRAIAPEGATAMPGGNQASAGGLKWNPAWEQQRLPTLPYIRRHVDHTSPRSAFEQHNPSGAAGNYTDRDDISGADRFVCPPGYFVHESPIPRKRRVQASGAEGESHTGYHQPGRAQLYASPRIYHPSYISGVHSSVAIRREQRMPSDTGSAGDGSHWRDRREHREQPRASDNRGRWRDDDNSGWVEKSEDHVYLPTGQAYQPATERGDHRRGDPRRYRSDQGGRISIASSLSDSSGRGYKYGFGLPSSVKEPAKMVGAADGDGGGGALSDPYRGHALARGGAVVGRGRRGEHPDYRVGNEGYSDSQTRRGVAHIASRESVSERKSIGCFGGGKANSSSV